MLPVVAAPLVAVVPGVALLESDGWLAFGVLLESPFAGGGFDALLLAEAALLLALLAGALFAGGGGGDEAPALF